MRIYGRRAENGAFKRASPAVTSMDKASMATVTQRWQCSV
jgi:hypothetical protein